MTTHQKKNLYSSQHCQSDIENSYQMSSVHHSSLHMHARHEVPSISKREERDQHGCGMHLLGKHQESVQMPYCEQSMVFNDKTQLITNSPAVKQHNTLQEILLSNATNNSESKYGRIYDVPTPYVPYPVSQPCPGLNTNSTERTNKASHQQENIKKEHTQLSKKISQATVEMEIDFLTTDDTRRESVKEVPHNKMNRKQLSQITQQLIGKQQTLQQPSISQGHTKNSITITQKPVSPKPSRQNPQLPKHSPYTRQRHFNELTSSVLDRSVLQQDTRSKSRSISPLQSTNTPYRNQRISTSPKPSVPNRFGVSAPKLQPTPNRKFAPKTSPISTKYSPKPSMSSTSRLQNHQSVKSFYSRSPCYNQYQPSPVPDRRKSASKSPLQQKPRFTQSSRSPSMSWGVSTMNKNKSPNTRTHSYGYKPAPVQNKKTSTPYQRSPIPQMRQSTQRTTAPSYQRVHIPKVASKPATIQAQSVLRVLNSIDYSIVNEFCRIDRPSQAVLNLGHLLCQFLHFVKDPANSVELIDVEGKTWQDVCMVVKRNISNSLFEFKERIKSLVKNKLPEQASQLLKWLKKAQYLMKQELRPYVRQSRALRIFAQLCWVTFCQVLEMKQDLSDDLFGEGCRLGASPMTRASNVSRSRSPIYTVGPGHQKNSVSSLNPALVTSVLNQRQHQKQSTMFLNVNQRYKPTSVTSPTEGGGSRKQSIKEEQLQMTERTMDHSSDLLLRMEEVNEFDLQRATPCQMQETATKKIVSRVFNEDVAAFDPTQALTAPVPQSQANTCATSIDVIQKLQQVRKQNEEEAAINEDCCEVTLNPEESFEFPREQQPPVPSK